MFIHFYGSEQRGQLFPKAATKQYTLEQILYVTFSGTVCTEMW